MSDGNPTSTLPPPACRPVDYIVVTAPSYGKIKNFLIDQVKIA
jgi:hypothetical protein